MKTGASGFSRTRAILAKDFAELRQSPGIFVPPLITGIATVIYPFVIAVIVPHFTGERLSNSGDFEIAVEMYRTQPATLALSPEGAIQAMIFQFALILMVGLTTVTGGMSVAAHSVIGEKQARTLEPLLATPLRTTELLLAKVIGAAAPGIGLTSIFFAIYVVAVARFGEPGVWAALLTPHALGLVFVLGPLAALLGLQLAVCASSRASDVRSAQQLGALVIAVPMILLQVTQVVGGVTLTTWIILGIAAGLVVANALVLRFAIGLFDRESILTRWK